MTRFLGVLLLAASACVAAETDPDPPAPEVVDGGSGTGDVDGGGTGNGGTDGGTSLTCEPPAATLPNGNHNPGAACLGCHTGTAAAPKFYVGGTLFSTAQGGAAVPGATIIVRDARNVTVRLITATNGNFYTKEVLTPPFTVKASKCPSPEKSMPDPASGNCNSCHVVGTAGRIHL